MGTNIEKLNNNLMGTNMHEVAKKGTINLIPKVLLRSKALRRLKRLMKAGHKKKDTISISNHFS